MGGESERKQKAVGKKQSNKLRWAARQRQMESEQVRRAREGDRQKETIVSTYADESRGGGNLSGLSSLPLPRAERASRLLQ